MVRLRRWWIGIAAGVALGLGAVVSVEVATEDASAQGGFRVSAEQLRINQRISQAAVRRSNESLQLLDPIRRRQNQPARVLGWRTEDLRDSAITTAKLANDSVTTAKLANDSVTNQKIGPNAVTGAKIAAGTITAANIANGQVVKGDGNFVTGRQVLVTTAADVPVLTLPGVGQLRASCTAGATSINFLNQSGAAAEVTAWGVNDATPLTQLTPALANGAATTGIAATGTFVLGLDYQVGFVGAGNVQEVTTATISAGPSATSCSVTASAVTTG